MFSRSERPVVICQADDEAKAAAEARAAAEAAAEARAAAEAKACYTRKHTCALTHAHHNPLFPSESVASLLQASRGLLRCKCNLPSPNANVDNDCTWQRFRKQMPDLSADSIGRALLLFISGCQLFTIIRKRVPSASVSGFRPYDH